MFLPTNKHNRRQFLERSMLGFGSAFVLPSLLASCTDHIINPPPPPIKPPLLGDDNIDWNNLAKTVVTIGLGEIPVVGNILSGLAGVFWPSSGTNVWDKVQTDLEISTEVYDIVKDTLGSLTPTPIGLISYVLSYQQELNNKVKTNADILSAWISAVKEFRGVQGLFQDPNNQVALLPLFAQFANLYLALLRDGVIYGKIWGRSDGDHLQDFTDLTTAVNAFIIYAHDTFQTGLMHIVNNTTYDQANVEPFRSTNAYERQMTLTVLDYMDTWKYYDVAKYPGAINPDGSPIPLYTREIYSDPYGNLLKISGDPNINLPTPATQFPTQITVWGGERIDAVQLTYPAGGGPGGVTTTPRMGDQNGGSTNAPQGGTVDFLPQIPITSVYVSYDFFDVLINGGQRSLDNVNYINTLQLNQTSGNTVIGNLFGGAAGYHKSGEIKYPNYALSSIYIHGAAEGYPDTSCDCIVFGFLRQR